MNKWKRATHTVTLVALIPALCSCHGGSAGFQKPTPIPTTPPEPPRGYAALDYRSPGAPPLAKAHEREIAAAIRRERPADRSQLRYTIALTGRGYGDQHVFVIYRDIGQPKDPRWRQFYAVTNLRNVSYDPFTNTIVAEPPF